jgi:putative transposase
LVQNYRKEAIMTAWKLSGKEWDALDELRFSTTDAAVFRNATIILMSGVGRSKPSIAHDLGCSIGTVDNVRKHYRQRGLPGLVPGKPPGRTSRATPEYRAALQAAIQTSPQQLGYGFSVWSLARLNAHLQKQTGIGFSDDQLGRIMHQEEFSFQRPKHTMKGKRDEVAYERAAARLRTLKKRPSRAMLASC